MGAAGDMPRAAPYGLCPSEVRQNSPNAINSLISGVWALAKSSKPRGVSGTRREVLIGAGQEDCADLPRGHDREHAHIRPVEIRALIEEMPLPTQIGQGAAAAELLRGIPGCSDGIRGRAVHTYRCPAGDEERLTEAVLRETRTGGCPGRGMQKVSSPALCLTPGGHLRPRAGQMCGRRKDPPRNAGVCVRSRRCRDRNLPLLKSLEECAS